MIIVLYKYYEWSGILYIAKVARTTVDEYYKQQPLRFTIYNMD